jgi:integrase
MDFWIGDRRYTGSTKCGDQKEAEKVARKERDEAYVLYHAQRIQTGVDGKVRDMTVLAAVDMFWDEIGQYDVGAHNTERFCDRFVDQVGEKTLLSQVTDRQIAAWQAKLKKKHRDDDPDKPKLSEEYINMHIDLAERILRRARKIWKIPLPDEPNWREHKFREDPRTREMTMEEYLVLEEHCRPDIWPAVDFTFESGLRKENAITLTWKQIDWEKMVIAVVVKGKKDAEVPITPEIEKILRAQEGKHPERVFTILAGRTITINGRSFKKGTFYPLTVDNFSAYWGRLRKVCGIEDLRIHDLRRTRGGLIYRATGDIAATQAALHHAKVETTKRAYAKVTTEHERLARATATGYQAELQRRALAERRRKKKERRAAAPAPRSRGRRRASRRA